MEAALGAAEQMLALQDYREGKSKHWKRVWREMVGAGCADGDIVTKWINDFMMDLVLNEQESTGIPNAYQLEAETQRLREAFERDKLIEQDVTFCAEQLRSVIDPATEVHQPPSEAAVSQSGSDHQSQADPQSEAGATHGTHDEPAETDPQDEARPFALIAKTAHPRSFQTFYGADSAAWFLSSCDDYESP